MDKAAHPAFSRRVKSNRLKHRVPSATKRKECNDDRLTNCVRRAIARRCGPDAACLGWASPGAEGPEGPQRRCDQRLRGRPDAARANRKRGFNNIFGKDFAIVNLGMSRSRSMRRSSIPRRRSITALKAAYVARGGKDGVRLLAKGELTALPLRLLRVEGRISGREKAGGKSNCLRPKRRLSNSDGAVLKGPSCVISFPPDSEGSGAYRPADANGYWANGRPSNRAFPLRFVTGERT